jgi:hypothetical protein
LAAARVVPAGAGAPAVTLPTITDAVHVIAERVADTARESLQALAGEVPAHH